jgi:DNA-binding MarR family transcriptional regulator
MKFDSMDDITMRNSSLYARLLLGRARHLMYKARQKELTPYCITHQQANLLFILFNLCHKATLTELAKYSYRGTKNVSMQMIRMEKDGLVKKVRETPKSALLSFELTEKGVSTYKNCYKMRSVKAIMSVLSEEERQQLISTLNKIINKAEKYQ